MSVKSIIRASVAVLALLGLAGHAGQRGAAAAPQTPSPAASPAAPAAPPSASPGKDPLLEFVPSEHVPADSAVSFPVDI
jgi:hypothetical protein